LPDEELIVEGIGGGGGPTPPPGGGDGGDDGKRRRPGTPSSNRYYTGITLGIVSILMFFMALASAFLVRRGTSGDWIPVHLPGLPLLGGRCALLFFFFSKFEKTKISLPTAAEITSYYWHFMDGLWVFLLALLYLGK